MPIIKKGKQLKIGAAASWEETIIPLLQNDPEFAATYLLDCLREENPNIFLRALNDIITAYGGFSAFARLTGMNRTNLHRTLSEGGNPTWSSLQPILQSLGIELSLDLKKSRFIKSFPKPDKKPVSSEQRLKAQLRARSSSKAKQKTLPRTKK
jgi:probable addiction module antidote protein